jgi:hypothetical protein
MGWEDVCGICDNDNAALWWRSRLGYKVCRRCAATPLDALELLARRGRPGLVSEVQAWGLQGPMLTIDGRDLANERAT